MFRHLKQLAAESVIYGLAGVISRFLTMLLVPVYTRIFSPADYGIMSLVSATMVIVSIFVVLGMDNAAGRFFWDSDDPVDRKLTIATWTYCQLATSLLLCLIILIEATDIARYIVGNPNSALYFRIAAFILPLTVLQTVLINWFRMQRRPWSTMFFALGTNALNIVFTFALVVMLHSGLQGVYWGQILGGVVGSALAGLLLGNWIHWQHFSRSKLKSMLRFSLPLIPAALAFWVVGFADRYFVRLYTDTGQVGLYQIGSSIAALVALATGAFQQAWGPFAFSLLNRPDANQVYASVLIAYLWITCLVSTALSLFAPEIIRLVAPGSYAGASSVVALLTFSYVMIGLGYIAVIGPSILRTTTPTGIAVTIAAILNIPLNVALVPHFGKVGSAVATLVSQTLIPVYVFYRAQRMYPIPYRFGPAIGLLALSASIIGLAQLWEPRNFLLLEGEKLCLLFLFVPSLFLVRVVTFEQAREVARAAAGLTFQRARTG